MLINVRNLQNDIYITNQTSIIVTTYNGGIAMKCAIVHTPEQNGKLRDFEYFFNTTDFQKDEIKKQMKA